MKVESYTAKQLVLKAKYKYYSLIVFPKTKQDKLVHVTRSSDDRSGFVLRLWCTLCPFNSSTFFVCLATLGLLLPSPRLFGPLPQLIGLKLIQMGQLVVFQALQLQEEFPEIISAQLLSVSIFLWGHLRGVLHCYLCYRNSLIVQLAKCLA
jgi:hypothetical protein